MLVKTIYREATLYGQTTANPALGLKTPAIQLSDKKFLTWEEVNSKEWGRYNEQIRFLALHGLRWSEAAVITENDIILFRSIIRIVYLPNNALNFCI
jgi:integrase